MEKMNAAAEALRKKGYLVECFATKEDAAAYVSSALDHTVIGIGGSATVEQMGLYPLLETRNTVYWHALPHDGMTVPETRLAACRAAVYISSANAVSEDGIIINIDGTGNRTSAIAYGPQKVYFVVGQNKIAKDYESAMYRARNVAAPLNAQRLHRKTPCAVRGDRCYDCSSPERICRNFSVFYEKPNGAEYHVILIGEDLGF